MDYAVRPVPGAALVEPEPSEQARLLTVIGAVNGAAKENEPAVIMAAAEQLPGMPRKRRSIECDQDQRKINQSNHLTNRSSCGF